MGTFGDKLRREREMRAVTLDEIAEATKIGTRSLKALEDEKFDILPGGIFNKGFVRAYARYLGIDQEQAVVDYMAAAGEQIPEKSDAGEIGKIASQAEQARLRREALDAASGKQSSGSWKSFIVLVLLIGLGAGGWKFYELKKEQKLAAQRAAIAAQEQAAKERAAQEAATAAAALLAQQQAAAATTDPNVPQPTSDGTTPVNATPSTAAPAATSVTPTASKQVAQEFHVQIRAKQISWVRVIADGRVAISETLPKNEERTFNARAKLVLELGNPGGLEVQWNGKVLSLPVVTTKKQTLTFTPDGMQE